MLTLTYEVSTKVEALHLDGAKRFVFQGKLATEGSDSEPLNLALAVPEELWRATEVGEVLHFPLSD